MNHRFQFPDVIALVGKGPLGDDASAVQLGVDVMDRHAEDLDAVFQRLLDGMRPVSVPTLIRINIPCTGMKTNWNM